MHSLVEIGPVVLEKKIFKISSMYFCYFLFIPTWKRPWPFHLNKLESSSSKDALCQVWLKLAQWFWRRRWKVKSLRTDGRTDRRTTGNEKRSPELSAQVSLKWRWWWWWWGALHTVAPRCWLQAKRCGFRLHSRNIFIPHKSSTLWHTSKTNTSKCKRYKTSQRSGSYQEDCEKKCPFVDKRFISYCNMHKYLQETVLKGQGIGKCNEQNMHRVHVYHTPV